ncbi:MAG: 16S rRNA (guanine(527)-N(7))-methyltransferase RsmG [Bacteroidales bacterium]|jgi:16S rRNA (guanine527-N7)-methyltransferase|nr:16S rRNA (guanine(527)-N(7))-methyltransferase RsmG [Bacteroidales bacterium]
MVKDFFKDITPQQEEMFAQLTPLYEDWNSKINVVSRKDIDKLQLHHVLHSLAIAKFAQMAEVFKPGTKIMDVGTGGGFPGIPLAIMFPEVDFLLVDSIGKKIKVVTEVANALGLKNVRAVKARAEEIDEKFDFVVSRAVTDLGNFLPWVKGKYTKGVIYLKGGDLNPGGALYQELENAAAKCRIEKKKMTFCPIEMWFADEFFKEKYVIYIPR